MEFFLTKFSLFDIYSNITKRVVAGTALGGWRDAPASAGRIHYEAL